MRAPIVLVAYASQSGSTARIATEIAGELRAAGIEVDCRAASEVESVERYAAVVLGSGVYVRSRASDGGGFLARHAGSLRGDRTWLFCAGPIGRCQLPDSDATDCAVVDVARRIGARGAAAFGALGPDPAVDVLELVAPVDLGRVRSWAREIAADVRRDRGALAAAC